MSLTEGTRLGAYEINGRIGAGGMGEVYRATDSKLGRDVAIKTLPAALASDRDRLARFEREAKLLASLNHAHIASIYSLDEQDGTLYLAMELIDGDTLEEKLKPGKLPVEDALRLALQIADALEAAHASGVVHRDLKPANVMITRDGVVKVLDFGLAKAFAEGPADTNAGQSPALSLAMTQQGLVLGTAGYMSPEQASGQPADQRADIWAFGVVLYEMLSGLPLFSGESVPHILADVLKTEPDWNRLPENLHPRVRLLLERCLAKKPRNRLHAIADARIEIESALREGSVLSAELIGQQSMPAPSISRRVGVAFGLFAIGSVISGGAVWRLKPEDRSVTRFAHSLPEGVELGNWPAPLLSISPKGDRIVYAASDSLYLLDTGELDAVQISQTVGDEPTHPVFSPDGESIAYFSRQEQRLKRVDIDGGNPVAITRATPTNAHLYWTDDDRILWSQDMAIMEVPAGGGEPTPIVESDRFIGYPSILPGGEELMYFRAGENGDNASIVVRSLNSGEEQALRFGGANPRYLEGGYLVYYDGDSGSLVARNFDPATLERDPAPAVSIVDGLLNTGRNGTVQFAAAASGSLTYIESPGGGTDPLLSTVLAVLDADGDIEPLDAPRFNFAIDVSPDGSGVVVEIRETSVRDGLERIDIWYYDLSGENQPSQLTLDGVSGRPAWSPDGESIVFASTRDGTSKIYRQSIPAGVAEPLTTPADGESHDFPVWAPDGRLAYFVQSDIGGGPEWHGWISAVPDGPAVPLINYPGDQAGLRFSPDGNAMAYWSRRPENNQLFDVFVEPFPPNGFMRRVAAAEPDPPWLEWVEFGDTLSLIYQRGSEPSAILDIKIPGFDVSNPREGPIIRGPGIRRFDSIPGTDNLLIVQSPADGGGTQNMTRRIIVVKNWVEDLKERVRAD